MTCRLTAHRTVGGTAVSALGLGCAGFSLDHAGDPARAERTVRAAVEQGVTLLDTALAYTPAGAGNHNERLIRSIVARMPAADRDRLLIATKGGHCRSGDAFPVDGRPATLRAHCEASLRALGTDTLALYHLHWPDPGVPLEDSVGALAELQRAGKIERIGVSNVGLDQLRRAQSTAVIASVQNRLNVFEQDHRALLEHCERTGTAFLAHSPLGGAAHPGRTDPPAALAGVAAAHGITPAQTALAWLLALSPAVIPIVGASRPESLASAVGATRTQLSPQEMSALS
jgi:aryl-alcohol dehydrogenase-like predicted oxidoreductase